MLIAVAVDSKGTCTSPYGECALHVFDNEYGAWTRVREIAFQIGQDMRLLKAKAALREAVSRMPDCKVFVSTETRGFVNAVLQEEFGFHTWSTRGPLPGQLDVIATKELELAQSPPPLALQEVQTGCGGGCRGSRRSMDFAAGSCPPEALERVGEGHYRINLMDVLKRDPDLNSRMVLLPILEDSAFEKLEIFCDHVPRWFAGALAAMRLTAAYQPAKLGVNIMVSPAVG